MSAAIIDVKAYKRVPWTGTFVLIGPDYSDGAFSLQIRQHPGDSGTPLLTASISATFNPAYDYYSPRKKQTITAPATVLSASVSEADLEALPLSAEEEKPLELAYDLHITPSGGDKHVSIAGRFDVYPGVTI